MSTAQKLYSKEQMLREFAHKLEQQERIDTQGLMEQMVSTYPEEIWKCVDRGKKAIENRDFYVCSALKREPLTPKIWKNQFFYTIECPRPYLNFSVFKYHRNTDELELLWTLPDKETLNFYYTNRHKASPEDYVLLKYIIEYKDGTLYRKMQELNGETPDKPELIVHDHSIFH